MSPFKRPLLWLANHVNVFLLCIYSMKQTVRWRRPGSCRLRGRKSTRKPAAQPVEWRKNRSERLEENSWRRDANWRRRLCRRSDTDATHNRCFIHPFCNNSNLTSILHTFLSCVNLHYWNKPLQKFKINLNEHSKTFIL